MPSSSFFTPQRPWRALPFTPMSTKGFASLIGPLATVVLAAFLTGGCSDVERRSYQVTVKNESLSPVTVWLTKDGPIYEPSWRSPEDLAIETRGAGEMIAGKVIPPGKEASIGPKEGAFKPHTNAILRVYLGEHNFSDLLSINRGDPDRRDYELDPGYNTFAIIDRDGRTVVRREGQTMQMSADK